TKLRVARRLAQKMLGFRYVMDVIPLHGDFVRGSHGRLADDPVHGPVLIGSSRALRPADPTAMTDLFSLILTHLERRSVDDVANPRDRGHHAVEHLRRDLGRGG